MKFAIIKLQLFFGFLFLMIPVFMFSLSVGSNTAVSRQGSVVFPQADSDNEMKGFASFENGFVLTDKYTTCTYDNFFPINGSVAFNYGSLYLLQDLTFDEGTQLVSAGSIYGNNHSVSLPESVSALSGPTLVITLEQVDQENPTAGAAAINSVVWSANGNYAAIVIDSYSGSDFFVYYFNRVAKTLTLSSEAYLTSSGFSVDWNPLADYIAVGRSSVSGGELRVYPFNQGTGQLGTNVSGDAFANIWAVSWYRDGNYLAVGTDHATNKLKVYKFSTINGTLGSELSISAQPGGNVSQDALDWDVTGSYLGVGVSDASGSNLLIYYLANENTLTLTQQIHIDGVTTVQSLDFSPTDSLILVGLSDGVERLRVYHFDYNPAHWVLEEKTVYRTGESASVLSVKWGSNGQRVAASLAANGSTEIKIYLFNKDESLSFFNGQEFSTNVNCVRWDYNNAFLISGDEAGNLTAFSSSYFLKTPIVFDSVHFGFVHDISWDIEGHFSGFSSIDGGGGTLLLADGASIMVSSGGQLVMKNMKITGLSGTNISCQDDTASIMFKNCEISLSDDFNFGNGSLLFSGDVLLTGMHVFAYATVQGSTIDAQSSLHIDHDMTFYYEPSVASMDLIYMTDKSSSLFLDGCTLKSTATGMRLTRGRLFLDNNVTFSCSVISSNAIHFGNGNAADDLDVTWCSGAWLDVTCGWVDDNVA